MDMNISQILKLISIFSLNGYKYKSDTKNMNVNMDINLMIKFYGYRIKYITK